jgi:hypothetical protein
MRPVAAALTPLVNLALLVAVCRARRRTALLALVSSSLGSVALGRLLDIPAVCASCHFDFEE